MRLRVGQNKRL